MANNEDETVTNTPREGERVEEAYDPTRRLTRQEAIRTSRYMTPEILEALLAYKRNRRGELLKKCLGLRGRDEQRRMGRREIQELSVLDKEIPMLEGELSSLAVAADPVAIGSGLGKTAREVVETTFEQPSTAATMESDKLAVAEQQPRKDVNTKGIAEGAMSDLPALSDFEKRKLAVQWDTIRDNQKLTDEHLSGYDRERGRLLGVAAKPTRAVNPLRSKEAALSLGLDPSVKVAEARFRQTDWEYWRHWCSSGFGHEVYRDWLHTMTRQISNELASIWKGKSDVTDRWFTGTCAPAIERALAVLVKQRIAQARDIESKRLEQVPTGNPIFDEIRAGGDNLSLSAQNAIRLAWAQTEKREGPAEDDFPNAKKTPVTEAYRTEPTHAEAEPKNEKIDTRADSAPKLLNRASWFKARLAEREWNKHDLQRHAGPEHRTTQKILDGLNVQEDVLQKAIRGLQWKMTHKGINLSEVKQSEIPSD